MKNKLFKKIHNVLFCFIIIASLNSCKHDNKKEFYLPAEWENQTGIIIGGLDDTTCFEMATQISREMKVYCFVVDTMKETYKRKLADAGATIDSVYFITASEDFWYAQRDGILFLKNETGEKKLMNFEWNAYGWYLVPKAKSFMEEDKISRAAYIKAVSETFPFPLISSTMVNEGGAIETNGKGTILQVEAVNMQRNPNMTLAQQEAELKKTLNAKKIIWLKEGAAEDPSGNATQIVSNYFGIGVKGHLDEFCRFVNDSTILISFPDSAEAENDPVKKITLERMKVNYEILKNSTDQDGKHFTVVKMPVPYDNYLTFALDTTSSNDEIKSFSHKILRNQKDFSLGDTVHFVPSSSYLNFLITNKTVFAAKYYEEGTSLISKEKDERAKQLLQHYFPDKKIYQINTTETNLNGGGLHCWSMQIPE
ncbi:MAG: agmatine deiminase family protein [Bacteroidota bacterium]